MPTFYFVGGPAAGQEQRFFKKLEEIGGTPEGWKIYPHVIGAGALHIVEAPTQAAILAHLANFSGYYERGDIVEVRARK